jgi:hypothetical protein
MYNVTDELLYNFKLRTIKKVKRLHFFFAFDFGDLDLLLERCLALLFERDLRLNLRFGFSVLADSGDSSFWDTLVTSGSRAKES